MRLVHFFGQFHPASTHLPVGLLLGAALAELGYWVFPRPTLHNIAAFNLHVGALGAIATATMGWMLAATIGLEPDLKSTLYWHRWLGTFTAAWACAALVLWYISRRSAGGRWLGFYRLALFMGALLVSITGHLGGLIVYGLDYYTGLK